MKLVAENLNVISKRIGAAMKERDAAPIRELAEKMAAAGADYFDVNIGPASKNGPEMIEWIVSTVKEVTDTPLVLDTTNVDAIEAGLKCADRSRAKPVINSISARPERMDALFPLAKKYDAGIVALLIGPDGIPRDENERAILWSDLMMRASEFGIEPDDIWVDPIVLPINSQQAQVQGCTAFMQMFNDIAPGYGSICGLSNISNGAPAHLRPILNQTYMVILNHYGMSGAIIDIFDDRLKEFASGGMQDVRDLIIKTAEGVPTDTASLSPEQLNYVKTANVLLGRSLYSDSWLEI